MIGIIKKDMMKSLMFVVLIVVLEFIYGYAAWDMVQKYAASSILLVCNTIFVVLFSHFFMVEQAEAKNNGYDFLKILPLKTSEIVTGKFLLVLFIDILYVFFTFFVVGLFSGSAEFSAFWRAYIIVCAIVSLNVTAVLYVIVYKFGFNALFKIIVQLLGPLFLIVTFILWFVFRDVLTQNYHTQIVSLFNHTNLFWAVISGLIFFIGLMNVSIRVYNNR
ncbi:ABC-2 transporter permease [candidate division KSB1 bacterium]|nr:ABC-2 transporter permease [candidate division KSB1 bacterium]